MAGFFDNLFGDDDTTSFFGGYRPRSAASPADPTGFLLPISDTTPAGAPPTATGAAPDVLTYPDGTAVTDPKGNPYPRPPGLDMQKNLEIGDQINEQFQKTNEEGFPVSRDFLFAPFFPAGAMMDYKRPAGVAGPYERQFRPVSYYNYGVMSAKVGYDRDEALRNAGLYNRIAGGRPADGNRYGLDGDDAEEFIKQGYNDYTTGRWTQKPSE